MKHPCFTQVKANIASIRKLRTDFRSIKRKLEAHGTVVITERGKPACLSRVHTPKLGTRALDLLHVACALELKLRGFLTLDARQQELAGAVGFKLVRV